MEKIVLSYSDLSFNVQKKTRKKTLIVWKIKRIWSEIWNSLAVRENWIDTNIFYSVSHWRIRFETADWPRTLWIMIKHPTRPDKKKTLKMPIVIMIRRIRRRSCCLWWNSIERIWFDLARKMCVNIWNGNSQIALNARLCIAMKVHWVVKPIIDSEKLQIPLSRWTTCRLSEIHLALWHFAYWISKRSKVYTVNMTWKRIRYRFVVWNRRLQLSCFLAFWNVFSLNLFETWISGRRYFYT